LAGKSSIHSSVLALAYKIIVSRKYSSMAISEMEWGGQKKRFNDTLNASMKSLSIDPDSWEAQAENRTTWRGLVSKGD
jgi:hypothetical protein